MIFRLATRRLVLCLAVPAAAAWLVGGPVTAQKPVTSGPPRAVGLMMPAPVLSVDGMDSPGNANPADAMGDVGPNHYVHIAREGTTNSRMTFRMQVFDKAGTLLAGPTSLYGLCPTGGFSFAQNFQFPTVLYDRLAD